MSTAEHSRVRSWSFRLFIVSVAGIPTTAVILFFGMMMTGGGHGTERLWLLGLLLSFVCWLVVAASCITGFIAWRRGGRIVWWAIPELLVFVALTLLGLWGMGG